MITPAPKSPLPVTSPCTTRLVAAGSWPVLSKAISVTRAVLRDTRACVRIPAGFRRKLRLIPSTLPTSKANPKRPTTCQKADCIPKSMARYPPPEVYTVLRRGYVALPVPPLILNHLYGRSKFEPCCHSGLEHANLKYL